MRFKTDLANFITLFNKENLDDIPTKKIDAITPAVFNTDAKVIVLNIGMGGGKTTQTIEYLSKQKSYYGLLLTKLLAIILIQEYVSLKI